ncbi:sensor domain-containing diguanylate cyclase [Noviherbaspirillum sp.]|uniref:sensor domain-containing diguanylate cyclase n=1 Tax=Noviherbaspirillum sp. TaxID=1926288 RepID=UPI002D46F7C5|nr:sensor domain-containing diguanylate cyclase [Noviherbaspirillum sp.]HZW22498.1 sensor domain-containing diguanylate cyclase [Noviherbaspirillum sp.]
MEETTARLNSDSNPDSVELEKYRRVFHAMPDYATFSNLHTGVFIDVNPGFQKLIGYRREEVIGRASADIDLWVHAGHRLRMIDTLLAQESMTMETQLRNRWGEILDVEGSFALFRMDREDLLVAIVRDVTARKRQERELERYRTSLEKLVEQRTQELESTLQKLRQLAAHDELTGVGNRRDLNDRLEAEYQAFKRTRVPFSVAVFDLDNFKTVNDRFGHATGDAVIKAFAGIVQREMRVVDYVARYGGDEFVLILKGIGAQAAQVPLGRIRDAVLAYPWSTLTGDIAVSTSAGVASCSEGETADDTFRRADKALYAAKVQGRNRIVTADEG